MLRRRRGNAGFQQRFHDGGRVRTQQRLRACDRARRGGQHLRVRAGVLLHRRQGMNLAIAEGNHFACRLIDQQETTMSDQRVLEERRVGVKRINGAARVGGDLFLGPHDLHLNVAIRVHPCQREQDTQPSRRLVGDSDAQPFHRFQPLDERG